MKTVHRNIQRQLLRGSTGRRQPWINLARAARMLAERAGGAVLIHEPDAMTGDKALLDIRHMRRGCLKQDFPLDSPSATLIAEGFLAHLDAFIAPSTPPERRGDWAALIREGACRVLDLLDEQNAAEGHAAARRYGGLD